jgi:hypothetical protein
MAGLVMKTTKRPIIAPGSAFDAELAGEGDGHGRLLSMWEIDGAFSMRG